MSNDETEWVDDDGVGLTEEGVAKIIMIHFNFKNGMPLEEVAEQVDLTVDEARLLYAVGDASGLIDFIDNPDENSGEAGTDGDS